MTNFVVEKWRLSSAFITEPLVRVQTCIIHSATRVCTPKTCIMHFFLMTQIFLSCRNRMAKFCSCIIIMWQSCDDRVTHFIHEQLMIARFRRRRGRPREENPWRGRKREFPIQLHREPALPTGRLGGDSPPDLLINIMQMRQKDPTDCLAYYYM